MSNEFHRSPIMTVGELRERAGSDTIGLIGGDLRAPRKHPREEVVQVLRSKYPLGVQARDFPEVVDLVLEALQ